jgi:uncharacterized protein YjiS (DUF1127 family)
MSNQCPDTVIGYRVQRQARDVTFSVRLMRALEWVDGAIERYRQRQALRSMDDRILHDIGLTRADVDHETNKPLWRQ